MKLPRCILALLLFALAVGAGAAEPLTAAEQSFLTAYEQIRNALFSDDLAAARAAAADLPEGEALAESSSLTAARKAFKVLSARAVALARERPGYYIAHCTMFPGGADWVQTTSRVDNPYWGRSMPHCGTIEKQSEAE